VARDPANNLVFTRLIGRGKCIGIGSARLQFGHPVNIRLVLFAKILAYLRTKVHDDEIVHDSAIVRKLKRDFLARWER
jgi:hypothetical protein